ncbi:MAG: carboxypeptidase-like regulatory domain-containing protein, partial [Bacteroidota bacterium]
MKQALLNFLTFLFLSPLLFAQTVQLKGKIIDAQTAQPLAFVHIGIPAQGIGTASSETGAYSFYFSIDFLDDELEISHLGYYSQRFQLSELDMSKEFIIRLEPQLKLLDEVEVIGTEQPLVYFVEKAIKNFKKNYPNKLHYMTGFYRQATINRETINYMRVLEAAVDIQDPGIYKPTSNIKLKVKELRKSDDNLPLNYREELYRKRYGKRNELYRILVSNEIRGYKEMIHFNGSILNLMKRFPDKLTLKGVTYYDGRKVYIIELNHVIYDATIYLDSEDYGIYKYTTLLMPGYSKKYEKDFNPKGFD